MNTTVHTIFQIFNNATIQSQVDIGMVAMNTTLNGVKDAFTKAVQSKRLEPVASRKLQYRRFYPSHPLRPRTAAEILELHRYFRQIRNLRLADEPFLIQTSASSKRPRPAPPVQQQYTGVPRSVQDLRKERKERRDRIRKEKIASTKVNHEEDATTGSPKWATGAYYDARPLKQPGRPRKRVKFLIPGEDEVRAALENLNKHVCHWLKPCLTLIEMPHLCGTEQYQDILKYLNAFKGLLERGCWEDTPQLQDWTAIKRLEEINERLHLARELMGDPDSGKYPKTSYLKRTHILQEVKFVAQELERLL